MLCALTLVHLCAHTHTMTCTLSLSLSLSLSYTIMCTHSYACTHTCTHSVMCTHSHIHMHTHSLSHTHTLLPQIPQLQSPPFGSVGGAKASVAPHPPPSHVHPPPPVHAKASRRLSADQAISYGRSGFPEPPPMSVVPHLKGLHDYEYIAVLGRGHFGKVSW